MKYIEYNGCVYYSTAVITERFSYSYYRIFELIQAGKLRAVKQGGKWFIDPVSMDEYISKEVNPNDVPAFRQSPVVCNRKERRSIRRLVRAVLPVHRS